ncbi:MAG: xanthine dehydrogenase family protein molybdopterin-binding subunit [Deltaproteobacteria bacterium]|nr:xanthine dehydrogenase family protein molybdopterin-binding subunit [Deltaproteobacteria bacterium]
MEELFVGQSYPRVDKDKVTGRAQYVNDIRLPRMLYGKILYSEYAHARIKSIDTSKAERLPGVRAVLTGYNTPDVRVGFIGDQTPLKKDKVRQYRDEVAAVAATDPEIAEEALDLIKVEYEELPAIFDPLKAMKEEAVLIHEVDARGRPRRNNILPLPWKLEVGDVDKAREESAYVVKDGFRTTWVAQCCMGTSGCIAEFDLNNNLTIYSVTNVPFGGKDRLDTFLRNIGINGTTRVLTPVVGGSFGTKLDTDMYEFIAVLLAWKTRCPVKILFSREEEFKTCPPRQPTITSIEQGCDKDGKLTFRNVEMILDNGAYTSWGATTPSVMMVPVSSLYRVPNVLYKATCVYTNNIYCQAMRGYGNPQGTFAVECSMDQLAEEAGIDPMEFREINANVPNETSPMGLKITTCPMKECLAEVKERLDWKNKHGKRNGRGVGLGSLIHVGGGARVYLSDGQGVILKVDDEGNVTIITGGTDQGQGSETIIRQMVAEAIGFRPENVFIVTGDTNICPWDVGTHASRHTFITGNAAILACEDAKRKILDLAAKIMSKEIQSGFKKKAKKDPEFKIPDLDYSMVSDPSNLDIKNGIIFPKTDPTNKYFQVPAARILRRAHMVGTGKGEMVMSEVFYDPPNEMLDREGKGNLSCAYTFGTHGVEVEVDKQTGQVKILNYVAAHDVGRSINPMLIEGQIYGAAYMGTGYGLTEEIKCVNGKVENPDFLDYKILTAKDYIPIEPIIVEPIDPAGPFGAKGIGEPACVPSAPAIANAIYDAVGVRIKDLPITPEKVLAALKEKEKQDKEG